MSRKVEMVLSLVDRATRPARRIIRLQERMGRVAAAAQRGAARAAKQATRATDLYRGAVSSLRSAQSTLRASISRTNDAISRQTARLRSSGALIRNGTMNAGKAALVAGAMFTAYSGSAALAANSFMDPARQFEKFETILTTTEGNAQAAKEAMSWVEQFAVSTPYELDQVTASFVQLRAYGLDPTNGLLKTLGDTSAAMGKDVMQAVEAVADAVTGENERLKEFGIKAAKVGEYFEYTYTFEGQTQTMKALANDRAAIEKTLSAIFEKKFSGSMDRLSKTYDGMLSNVMDQWSKFQRLVMSLGVFDHLKGKLQDLLTLLNEMEADGRLQKYAQLIADYIMHALEALWSFGQTLVATWQTVLPWLQSAADIMGGWGNLALALLAIPLHGVIIGLGAAFVQLAGGAGMAAMAMGRLSFAALAGGALRLGPALLALLNPLTVVRAALVALRFAILATGIGAIAVGLAMAGAWIYNNWSGLAAMFYEFGQAFMDALGPAGPLLEGVVGSFRDLWYWLKDLVGPLDISMGTWASWGHVAGTALGNAVSAVADFVRGVIAWFAAIPEMSWDDIVAVLNWENFVSLFTWDSVLTVLDWATWLNPLRWLEFLRELNWSGFISEINWVALAGGTFLLSRLIKPITWSLRIIGGPIRWLALLGKFALSTLITPISWSLSLIGGAIKWTALLGKFALSTLLKPIAWVAALIPKIPWLGLAGGGKKFALRGLVTALKWGARLIPGIGWAVLAGELLWNTLIKPIEWSQWFNFAWSDLLPEWDWGFIGEIDLGNLIKWPEPPGWWKKLTGQTEQVIEPPKIADQAGFAQLPAAQQQAAQTVERISTAGPLPTQSHITDLELGIADIHAQIAAAQEQIKTFGDGPQSQALATPYNQEIAALNADLVTAQSELELARSQSGELSAALAVLSETEAVPTIDMASIDQALSKVTRLSNTLNTLPGGAANAGAAPVQARAGGGAFNPGWLLTGENGPELEYRSRGGYIAHNAALQKMQQMSERVRGALSSLPAPSPQGMLAGLAVSASVAGAANAIPPAAFAADTAEPGQETAVPEGAKYLGGASNSSQSVSISAPVTVTVQGNADASTLAQIEAMVTSKMEEQRQAILAELEDMKRDAARKEH